MYTVLQHTHYSDLWDDLSLVPPSLVLEHRDSVIFCSVSKRVCPPVDIRHCEHTHHIVPLGSQQVVHLRQEMDN